VERRAGRTQYSIHRLDNPSAGTFLVSKYGAFDSAYAVVVKDAKAGGQIVGTTGGKSSYVFTPPVALPNSGGILLAVARPYRNGALTYRFSWYYTVSPSDYDGIRALAVTRATPGYTASWSSVSSGGGYIGLWLEPVNDIPLFAFF
jgi:hypothetical protein